MPLINVKVIEGVFTPRAKDSGQGAGRGDARLEHTSGDTTTGLERKR
jgi:hypothetical protein